MSGCLTGQPSFNKKIMPTKKYKKYSAHTCPECGGELNEIGYGYGKWEVYYDCKNDKCRKLFKENIPDLLAGQDFTFEQIVY